MLGVASGNGCRQRVRKPREASLWDFGIAKGVRVEV